MPPVQSVKVLSDRIEISDVSGQGKRTFLFSSLPVAQDTPTKAQNYINLFLTGLSSNSYGIVCHVFTVSPLTLTIGTYSIGQVSAENNTPISLPSNWWER